MKINLNKPSGESSPGSAAPKNEIIIVEAESIDFFPPTDAGGVVIQGSFSLKPGEKMIKLYSTKSKTSASMETEGDEDSQSFKSKFDAQHPGNSKEVKEFVQYWMGRNVVILHKACGDDFYEVMGSPCAPLQLKATKQDNNDGRHYMLSFEPFAKSGFVPKIYQGAVVFADPFAVVAVTAVPLLVANGLQYKLPATAVAASIGVTGITLEHGNIVTLVGSGGANASTLTNGVSGDVTVLLKDGTTWTALLGAVICLEVFKAGVVTYLKEMSRG